MVGAGRSSEEEAIGVMRGNLHIWIPCPTGWYLGQNVKRLEEEKAIDENWQEFEEEKSRVALGIHYAGDMNFAEEEKSSQAQREWS